MSAADRWSNGEAPRGRKAVGGRLVDDAAEGQRCRERPPRSWSMMLPTGSDAELGSNVGGTGRFTTWLSDDTAPGRRICDKATSGRTPKLSPRRWCSRREMVRWPMSGEMVWQPTGARSTIWPTSRRTMMQPTRDGKAAYEWRNGVAANRSSVDNMTD